MTDKLYEVYSMWENEKGEMCRWALLGRHSTLEEAVKRAKSYPTRDDIDIFYRSGMELLAVAWDKSQTHTTYK